MYKHRSETTTKIQVEATKVKRAEYTDFTKISLWSPAHFSC